MADTSLGSEVNTQYVVCGRVSQEPPQLWCGCFITGEENSEALSAEVRRRHKGSPQLRIEVNRILLFWTECSLGVLAKSEGDVGDALGVINELFVLIVDLTTDQREV